MNNYFIILAAGKGKRFSSKVPKAYYLYKGKPLIQHSIDKVKNYKKINKIVIVINKKHKKFLNKINVKNTKIIEGGKTRAESTFKALNSIKNFNVTNVLIHDAARPNFSLNLLDKLFNNLKYNKCVVPTIKTNDSVKLKNNNRILNLKRENVYLTQTPQAFHFKEIFKLQKDQSSKITDDANLFISAGKKIKIINGERKNQKITSRSDIYSAGKVKHGIGFDIHRLESKRKLYLGGVKIPYHLGLKGHSDGDVIIHALIDSLLGACKLKDIGTLFSNKKGKYKNIRSFKMLNKVLKLINQKGFLINNIDINVIAERPKISKYRNKIIKSLSKLCYIDKDQINIKGKTTEKIGLIGKEKAIAAEVISSVIEYD